VKIKIIGTRTEEGEPSVYAGTSALPREGDLIEHEPSGISGYVRRASFWWNEHGVLEIQVHVK
jgi:hypothetical protein